MSSAGFHCTFTWQVLGDPCRQCQSLAGYTWIDTDIYAGTLWHPIWGDVWNLDLGIPLTHGGTGVNCKCYLDIKVTVNFKEIKTLDDLGIIIETPVDEVVDVGDDLSQLTEIREKITAINEQAEQLETRSPSLRQDVRLLNLLMADFSRLTGQKNLDAGFQKLQQIMMLALRIQLTINAINTMLMSPTPFGILYAGANFLMTGIMAGSVMPTAQSYRRPTY